MTKIHFATILAFILGTTALYWGTFLGVLVKTDVFLILLLPGVLFMGIFNDVLGNPNFGFIILLTINGIFYASITYALICSSLPLIGKREAGREIVL